MRCTGNPGGPGHAWVKQYFVDPHPQGGRHQVRVQSRLLERERIHTVEFIPARACDNPHLHDDYLFELERKPRALRDALLHGRWDAFEGQVFTEFCDDPDHYAAPGISHVIAPFPLPGWWPRWCSFDFGYTRPFSVGWWTVAPEGTLYRIGEWYGSTGLPNQGLRLSPAQIAQGILQREAAAGITAPQRVADPSIFDRSRGESVAEQMAREGVHFLPGDNTRLPGKMQLHYRLRHDTDGLAGLYVFSTCRDFIRTLPALCYDARRSEDIDTAAEDHIYDETRYLLMAQPLGAEPPRAGGVFVPRALRPLE